MATAIEIVTIQMNPADRVRLYNQIKDRLEKLGHGSNGYEALDLAFDLPANWPADINCELTLAQLVVVAVKLKMQIEITDLNMGPWRKSSGREGRTI